MSTAGARESLDAVLIYQFIPILIGSIDRVPHSRLITLLLDSGPPRLIELAGMPPRPMGLSSAGAISSIVRYGPGSPYAEILRAKPAD